MHKAGEDVSKHPGGTVRPRLGSRRLLYPLSMTWELTCGSPGEPCVCPKLGVMRLLDAMGNLHLGEAA